MYNTATCLEDLDIVQELYTYPGVSYVAENHQIYDENHKDADFEISIINKDGVEEIKQLLSPLGMSAYCVDDEVLRIN